MNGDASGKSNLKCYIDMCEENSDILKWKSQMSDIAILVLNYTYKIKSAEPLPFPVAYGYNTC